MVAVPFAQEQGNVTAGSPGWKEAINALTMYYGDRIRLSQWRSLPHTNS
jgi:hypothetical protein